jgi:chitodextrinase
LPPVPFGDYIATDIGSAYFPELKGYILANGAGGSGFLYLFNTVTQQWEKLASNLPMGAYHNFAEYNPVHKVVVFGGGQGNRAVYKADASKAVVRMKDAPLGLGLQTALFTVDPVSGDFLVFDQNRNFYKYNVLADTWTSLGGGSLPIWTTAYGNSVNGMAAASIPTYGVNLFVSCDQSNCRVNVYKHAGGTPPPTDTTPPTVSLTAPTAGATVSGTITVSATASDNVGVVGVQFKLNGANLQAEDTTAPYAIAWNTTAVANGSYTLTATARDAAGNQATAAGVTVTVSNAAADTTPPSTPTGLSATAVSASQINLAWAAATDNVGVTGYRIYRGGSQIATASTTSYQDAGLSASTTYTYTVAAYDAAGNVSGQSPPVSATTLAAPPPPPPPPPGTIGGYPMPSLQAERDTYTRWGWTWTASQEPNFPGDPTYQVVDPDIHGDTEGDDLWSYLMMYLRTGQKGYLDRAQGWLRYFKNDYRQCVGTYGYSFCYDQDSFSMDHLYGWGLVAWYEYTGDTAALTEAENIAAEVEAYWAYRLSLYPPGQYAISYYGMRQGGRHLLLATRLAEVTQKQRWITLRDTLIDVFLQSPDWDARGMYFVGSGTTDSILGSGAYASGARIQSAFHIGIVAEALFHAYRTTGNVAIKNRLIAMARYVDQYGLHAVYQYTGSLFGIVNAKAWHNYFDSGPVTFADSDYTTSLVNTLMLGYKYTGDLALYNRAKAFFNRGTKGVYGSPTARCATDTQVCHFVDTQFFYGYLDNNKGELQYTYLVFEAPGGPADTTPPTVTITTPTTAATYSTSSSPLTLGGTAADNVGVTQVTWANSLGGSGTASGTTSWTASGIALQGGTNLLTVTARDAAGNTGTKTLTVTYTPPDTTPPTTNISSGPSGTITVTSATFTWIGADNVTPVASLVYAFRLAPLEPSFSAFGPATSKSYTGLANGTYTLYVKARDAAGNEDPTPATQSFTVSVPDTTPPTVTITTPTTAATYSTGTSPLTLRGTAADNVGVTQVTWANSLGGSGTATGTTSWSASGIVLQSGTNVLTVTARDAAGNTGSKTLTVTYTRP